MQPVQLQEEMKKANRILAKNVSIVANEILASKFLKEQASFRANRKPCSVDIDYHHTRPEYVRSIKRWDY